jgi:glycosyltransferase involved in cell wall biosynthesis
VCHPEWRGIRTAAYTFRCPVVEAADCAAAAQGIVAGMRAAGASVLVVHGFPPGAEVLLRAATAAGISTRLVLHSSMAQHGAEPGEAHVADTVMDLVREGTVDRVGFVKAGLAEAFSAMGYAAAYVPNRAPDLAVSPPRPEPAEPLEIGVFAQPFWRKNVVTQLGSLALIPGARGHVLERPDVGYLAGLDLVEHGVLPWEDFIALQAGMDLNLYVTLSECHPLTPVESYLSGVPCLISRTSVLFGDDPELLALTSVAEADDPVAIAAAALRLMAHRSDAIPAARQWIARWDDIAAEHWTSFTSS